MRFLPPHVTARRTNVEPNKLQKGLFHIIYQHITFTTFTTRNSFQRRAVVEFFYVLTPRRIVPIDLLHLIYEVVEIKTPHWAAAIPFTMNDDLSAKKVGRITFGGD